MGLPINKLVDPENHQFLMETSLPTPTTARVYVILREGNDVNGFTLWLFHIAMV